jgi:phytanoyl-CoA hydroxylase
MKISEESLIKLRCVADEMEGTRFHFHTHILYDLRSELGPERKRFLEIGCAYGMTSSLILNHPFPTDYVAVDLGIPIGIEDIVWRNVEKFKSPDSSFHYVKGDSMDAKSIREVIKFSDSFDLIFIDGNHTKSGVLKDFENYIELLKIGGYLVFDDYLDQWDCPEVRQAVDEIVKKYGHHFEIIGCIEYELLSEFTHLPSNNLFMMKKKSDIGLKTKQVFLEREGYLVLKNFFPREKIEKIRKEAQEVFEIQFNKRNYSGSFKDNMIKLFNEDEQVFMNCGKTIQQGLISLYAISVDLKLISELRSLGLTKPNLCTRPVLFFNHPKLAKDEVYYKTPLHQDWPSMQSSSDSLVVWVPLIDVDEKNGSIIIYPKSHSYGNLSDSVSGGFASIQDMEKFNSFGFDSLQPQVEIGDIVIFSTFLVHKSGEILDDSIRWSCHFRYTNLLDKDFIERGFPNPYVYKPVIKED